MRSLRAEKEIEKEIAIQREKELEIVQETKVCHFEILDIS